MPRSCWSGRGQALEALLPSARLHLARGDHDLARAGARRGLRGVGADRLRAVELLAVLVDAELAAGSVEDAVAAGDRPAGARRRPRRPAAPRRGREARGPGRGRAWARLGRRRPAGGCAGPAWIRPACRGSGWRCWSSWPGCATARGTGPVLASTRAAATELLATLDAVLPADDRAARPPPRRGGDRPRAPPAGGAPGPGRPWWSVSYDGTSARLKDAKGLRYLAVLRRPPGVERHALDLVDRVEGVDPAAVDDGSSVTPVRLLDARPGPRTATASRSCASDDRRGPRRGPPGCRRGDHAEIDAARRPAGPGVRPRRAGAAGGVRGRAGPAQRDAGPPRRDRPDRRRPPDGRRRARPGVRTGTYCAYDPAPRRRRAGSFSPG